MKKDNGKKNSGTFVLANMRGWVHKVYTKRVDTYPDFEGRIKVDGTTYYAGVWYKTSQYGKELLSISLRPLTIGKRK